MPERTQSTPTRRTLIAGAALTPLALVSTTGAAAPQAPTAPRTGLRQRQVVALKIAIAERVGWLRMPNRAHATIRRAVLDHFAVPGLDALPRDQFRQAKAFIRAWRPDTDPDPVIALHADWKRRQGAFHAEMEAIETRHAVSLDAHNAAWDHASETFGQAAWDATVALAAAQATTLEGLALQLECAEFVWAMQWGPETDSMDREMIGNVCAAVERLAA